MKGVSSLGFIGSVAVLATAASCNAVLGNDPGQLAFFEDGGPRVDATPPVTFPDAGNAPDTGDTDAGLSCPDGEKICNHACVSTTDPLFGCGAETCDPCAFPHATAACAGNGACAVGACDPGYADCDKNPANGCETDLSQATHCGACNAVCSAAAPICVAQGGAFGCATGCTPQAPTLCGNQCVDLTTNVTHCGTCTNSCGPVLNGQVTCVAGGCTFACNAGFHACAGRCVSNSDPATCGGSCTPCATPPNGSATCTAGVCGFACGAGYHACGNVCDNNGDPATCGGSCTPCPSPPNATPTCANGSCGFACVAGFHACGAACSSNSSVLSCGASCTACPVGPNATATCNGTACGITCTNGFADCDANPANGCEVNTTNDPRNCGGCNRPCAGGQSCVNSVCVSPPDAGGQPG